MSPDLSISMRLAPRCYSDKYHLHVGRQLDEAILTQTKDR